MSTGLEEYFSAAEHEQSVRFCVSHTGDAGSVGFNTCARTAATQI